VRNSLYYLLANDIESPGLCVAAPPKLPEDRDPAAGPGGKGEANMLWAGCPGVWAEGGLGSNGVCW